MTVREVPREEWAPFLESFSAQHHGWLASLGVRHGGTSGPGARASERRLLSEARFHGASYEPDRILLMLGDNGHTRDHRIVAPEQVLVETADGGAHRGMSIVDRDGATSILRFRAAARPESLDGLAPAELEPEPAGGGGGEDGEVTVIAGEARLPGVLTLPAGCRGLVLFAHGSGSSRLSPRNQAVARDLNRAGLGTLLFDLLTAGEHEQDRETGKLRFDIPLIGERMTRAVDWVDALPDTAGLATGLFGASTGAAAALLAAAERPRAVSAVVSRGGRPDLAGEALERVRAPSLFIVGGRDLRVLDVNQEAARRMPGEVAVETVAGASHLFVEPGTLEEVSRLAAAWFARHLGAP